MLCKSCDAELRRIFDEDKLNKGAVQNVSLTRQPVSPTGQQTSTSTESPTCLTEGHHNDSGRTLQAAAEVKCRCTQWNH